MGLAIDTLAFHATNPGAAGAAVVAATGDSATVRNYTPGTKALLEQVIRDGATEGFVQILSPSLHDDVRGLRWTTAEAPSHFDLAEGLAEPLQSGDQLAITVSGGTAETDNVILAVYYQDAPGLAAPLRNWADIQGAIEHIKVIEVDVTNSGSPGTWTDTVITATENLLKADRKYAVLGYITDVAQSCIAVKGSDTTNLRVGGPGLTESDRTSRFFVDISEKTGTPHIPVIAANNRGATYVSTVDKTASSTPKVQLVTALLAASFA